MKSEGEKKSSDALRLFSCQDTGYHSHQLKGEQTAVCLRLSADVCGHWPFLCEHGKLAPSPESPDEV